MGVFSRLVIFLRLGLRTDAQSTRLEAHLDLLSPKPGNFSVCGKSLAGLGDMELHRCEQFGFREKPIFPVVSVRASAMFENLESAAGYYVGYVLRMFAEFMNG